MWTRRKVLRRSTPGEADVAQASPEKISLSVNAPEEGTCAWDSQPCERWVAELLQIPQHITGL